VIFSDAFPTTLRDLPCNVYVARNDGFCWGVAVFADGVARDITVRKDWYDYPDEDAAEAFIRKARRHDGLEPPMRDYSFLAGPETDHDPEAG
jgi:hypothetical protein